MKPSVNQPWVRNFDCGGTNTISSLGLAYGMWLQTISVYGMLSRRWERWVGSGYTDYVVRLPSGKTNIMPRLEWESLLTDVEKFRRSS